MPGSHLHGLNVIEPAHLDSNSVDLLSGPFPDLSLWTYLPFESDDGLISAVKNDSELGQMTEGDEEGQNDVGIEAAAIHDGHVNVVTGTTIGNDYLPRTLPAPPSLDLVSLMPSFGINPLVLVQKSQAVQRTPSLASSLSMNVARSLPGTDIPDSTHALHSQPGEILAGAPSAKRQRSRKRSLSIEESSQDPSLDMATTLTAAEDKRQRNTAASARFRLKKKEREIALENKAKELEIRVSELERKCEGLRRENGWLKGLVVGVTGAAQAQNSLTGP
ncbi:hypothetical protein F5890DRAFT_303121 [Lentinula detonsa]|uniref:BZIP domain-containing protein n=1 Tax=Lentinula detonsa TaxID=2804962 RepID=A0AA38PVX4_9AGAR|nr:hypothetical protein F5890DRAFT_303121 [Lentinula detonsa]